MIAEPILRTFRLDQLRPSRWQARTTFDPAALLDLAQSIQQHGLLNPLLVWIDEEGRPELLAGERRTRALLALALTQAGRFRDLAAAAQHFATHGLDELQPEAPGRGQAALVAALAQAPEPLCRVISGTPAELEQAALVDNLQRADLGALDEARALQRMIEAYGHSQRALAELIGKSQTYISHRLILLDLHPDLVAQHLAGELDLATARELARLEHGAQLAARNYAQQDNKRLASRQVKTLVAGVLELAEPSAWPAEGRHARPNALIAAALADKTPTQRQEAMVRFAAQRGVTAPRVPSDDWEYRAALSAIGVAEAGNNDVDKAFVANAARIGASCANCRVQPFAARVAMIRAQSGSRALSSGFPACAEGVTVCAGYISEQTTDISMPVPRDPNLDLPAELRAHMHEGKFWDVYVDDIPAGLEIAERVLAFDRERIAAVQDRNEHGFQRALAALAGDQATLSEHLHSQPCRLCAFHKRDSTDPNEWCQFQAQRPRLENRDSGNHLAQLWRNKRGQVIARCRLFRFARIEAALPELAGGLTVPALLLVALIKRLLPREYGSGPVIAPTWLNCARKGTPGADASPTWEDAEAYLVELAPRLTPGQRVALVALWLERFKPFSRLGETVEFPDPLTGKPDQWRCVVTYGQSGIERGEDAPQPPRTLAEVFTAAEPQPETQPGTLAAALTA